MTTIANAVKNQSACTTNGMKAHKSTASECVDLFFKIGAMRGQNVVPQFTGAYVENRDVALRIAQWARDVRGGAGERQIFRDVLKHLTKTDLDAARAMLNKVPELGRWDDVLVMVDTELEHQAFEMVREALEKGNGLCAKWMPRKGHVAEKLRAHLGYSPKRYRKTLVTLTNVVEQYMCSGNWDGINFSHVPSLAHSRYKKAFFRHTEAYKKYVEALVKGDDPKVKVNAGAVYPYDVLKGRISTHIRHKWSKAELSLIEKQWEALPNYVGDANILPMVDVSGSMSTNVGGSITAMDVAVSLGLYLSDKNTGKFKDTFLTFSGSPELLHLKGNINEKIEQMVRSKWEMNTDLVAAFRKVLKVAVEGNVPQEEMPEMLLILSDMQFDLCARFDDSALQSVTRQYETAGYELPAIVFWNIAARDNAPAKYNQRGVALVSGFSPSIVKSVLSADTDQFTPEGIMMKTIMVDRYAL